MKVLIDLGKGPQPMCADCAAHFLAFDKLEIDHAYSGDDILVKMAPGVTFEELRLLAAARHGQ